MNKKIQDIKDSILKNPKTLWIVGFVLVIIVIMFLKSPSEPPKVNPIQTWSGAQQTASIKGTQKVLNDLNKFTKDLKSPLVIWEIFEMDGELKMKYPVWWWINSSYYWIKFVCDINDDNTKNIISSWEKETGSSYDLSKISPEQLNLFKIKIKTSCENANSVLINKWLIFLKNNNNAVTIKEISPQFIITWIKNTLPIEFQKNPEIAQYLSFLDSAFSYERNINDIFNTEEKRMIISNTYQTLLTSYSTYKSENKIANWNQDVALKMMDSIIKYYTSK